MTYELFREDHTGRDRNPFATAETGAEAEQVTVDEVLNDGAEAVMVFESRKYVGTIYLVSGRWPEYACAICGATPDSKADHAEDPTVWSIGKEHEYYCSLECVNKRHAQHTWTNGEGRTMRLRASKVEIDNIFGDEPLDAYVVETETWNGWMIPFMTKPQADAWLVKQQEAFAGDDDAVASYDAANDAYTVSLDSDGEDGPRVFSGADWTNPEGQTVRLYCIGGWDWTWDEVGE